MNSSEICRGIESLVAEHLKEILSKRCTGRLKPDNSFVSDGDILCQDLLFKYIADNLDNCYIISEESDNDTTTLGKYEYLVTIDPIDGTENFVSGLKEWGIGVSIYKHMKHEFSMILLPELGECLRTGDEVDRINTSRICGLSSYMTPSDFDSLSKKFEYRIMGCCMYNMFNVIRGSYQQFQHLKGCYSWDILPGLNIALENGLNVEIEGKKYSGEFLYPNIKYRFVVK